MVYRIKATLDSEAKAYFSAKEILSKYKRPSVDLNGIKVLKRAVTERK